MKMKVVYTDLPETEILVGPRAQVEVERKFNCLYTDIFDETSGNARVEKFYYTAWAALHFSGHESAADEFDDWLNKVVDVIPVATRAKPDPTRRARKPARSST